LEKLKQDIEDYFNTTALEGYRIIKFRKNNEVSSKDTFKFFRYKERTQNTHHIIQYMVAFLEKLPLAEDIVNEVINPFEQFKGFVRYNIDLLIEADVVEGILGEYQRTGLLNDKNSWYYKGQIEKLYNYLSKMLDEAAQPVKSDYEKLLKIVQRLCLFWFSLRGENYQRVRKSDIFLYKLSKILTEKYINS
jgi:hypothetical protein